MSWKSLSGDYSNCPISDVLLKSKAIGTNWQSVPMKYSYKANFSILAYTYNDFSEILILAPISQWTHF